MIHKIKYNKDKNILYNPDNFEVFLANDDTVDNLNSDHINEDIYNFINKKVKTVKLGYEENKLNRLIINVSNVCNLRCKYCYASGGNYGVEENFICTNVLENVLSKFYKIFDQIDTIQLFGGEPALNLDSIEYVGKFLNKNNIKTQIGIVTNSTISDDRFIDLISKYKINVTVSIDYKTVHDKLRPNKDGSPTYDKIMKNILEMNKKTGQHKMFEVTYTNVHKENGINITDIIADIKSKFKGVNIHITPVSSEDKNYKLQDRNDFINSIKDIEQKNKSIGNKEQKLDYSLYSCIRTNIKYKLNNTHFCNAGINTIAVSTKGDIYPCFYFTENPNFKICNIMDDFEVVKSKISDMRKQYFSHLKNENEDCKNCFANTVCRGCIGANYNANKKIYMPEKAHCDMTRKMLEQYLIESVTKIEEKKHGATTKS